MQLKNLSSANRIETLMRCYMSNSDKDCVSMNNNSDRDMLGTINYSGRDCKVQKTTVFLGLDYTYTFLYGTVDVEYTIYRGNFPASILHLPKTHAAKGNNYCQGELWTCCHSSS